MSGEQNKRAAGIALAIRITFVAIVAAVAACTPRRDGLIAYYPDGTWTRYVADASTQQVRSVDSEGHMDTDHGCTVVDARNWICPAATKSDSGAPDWKWGALRAIDGRVESTDPRSVVSPISWTAWELGRIRKLL